MGSGMNSGGDIRRWAVLSRKGVFGSSTSYPAVFLHAFVGQRRVM